MNLTGERLIRLVKVNNLRLWAFFLLKKIN